MSTTLQNFYKATVTRNWTATTGDFNVSTAPTTSSGWLVISPNNATLREIVYFTATGTNSYGDFVTISDLAHRGIGGTTAQTHTIGEYVRMNITAEHWAEMQDDIDSIVAAGASNASTTTRGIVEEATQAEIATGTTTGGSGAKLFIPVDQSCQTFSKTVTLSSSDIQTMYTTPVQLIAAPGSSKVISLDDVVFYLSYGTATYAGGGTVELNYDTDGTQLLGTTNVASCITTSSSNVQKGNILPISTSTFNITVGINKAIVITNNTGVFTTGDGTLKVFLKYRILTL
jgi:hypothetical protein